LVVDWIRLLEFKTKGLGFIKEISYIKVLKKEIMAKVTIEFDSFEDKEEMESALNGAKCKMLVWDLDQHLRSELKYNDEITGKVYDALQKVRDYLHEQKTDIGLTLE
jgi:hypothetical protein